MKNLMLASVAALTMAAASSAASAAVLYSDTAGASGVLGYTPYYQSPSYSGYSPAQEFTATATGSVSSITLYLYNGLNTAPLTVSLWTTNAANTAFNTEIGSWTFNSQLDPGALNTQTVNVSAGPLLTTGVLYGIELAADSTAQAPNWLANANVTVPQYSVCNVAFYCTDPNGQTPTANSAYFTGKPASGPQALFVISGLSVAGVAEPATWAMMLAGFGGIGAMIRRRRTAVAFA